MALFMELGDDSVRRYKPLFDVTKPISSFLRMGWRRTTLRGKDAGKELTVRQKPRDVADVA